MQNKRRDELKIPHATPHKDSAKCSCDDQRPPPTIADRMYGPFPLSGP